MNVKYGYNQSVTFIGKEPNSSRNGGSYQSIDKRKQQTKKKKKHRKKKYKKKLQKIKTKQTIKKIN